ncbi:MAG: hypothetical protein WAO98_06650 [Alphaproteobacteria bacterium]
MKKTPLFLAIAALTATVAFSSAASAHGQTRYNSSDAQYYQDGRAHNHRVYEERVRYSQTPDGYIGKDGGYYAYNNVTNEGGPLLSGMNNGNENFAAGHISMSGGSQQ